MNLNNHCYHNEEGLLKVDVMSETCKKFRSQQLITSTSSNGILFFENHLKLCGLHFSVRDMDAGDIFFFRAILNLTPAKSVTQRPLSSKTNAQ